MGDALTFVSTCLFCKSVWTVTLERITKSRENDCTTHGDSCGTVPAGGPDLCGIAVGGGLDEDRGDQVLSQPREHIAFS